MCTGWTWPALIDTLGAVGSWKGILGKLTGSQSVVRPCECPAVTVCQQGMELGLIQDGHRVILMMCEAD